MVFTEPAFLFVYLPLLLAAYHLAPPAGRNLLLTLASLLFYAVGEWRFVPLLLASVALNYWIARRIDATRGSPSSRWWLAAGVVSDLALLFYFKYAAFLISQAAYVLYFLSPIEGPALPLGISFFTFHKISYKVDVYRGNGASCRSPLDLSLYILLFPQLIAGPIIRYHEIADQLVRRVVTREGFAEGVRRFTVGLAKKVLIANVVAKPADAIFGLAPAELTPALAWLGLVCYTIQIYFDFSGYSDMAIGLARMVGFRFPENFHYPYVATSVTDFWRRWHISLSRWFRDYVYVPLGGNRVPRRRLYANLLTVFVLCGLWHGAAWTFLAWGLLHGAFLTLERTRFGEVLARQPAALRHLHALAVVMAGWVLFRCPNIEAAGMYFAALGGRPATGESEHFLGLHLDPAVAIALALGVIGSLPVSEWLSHAFQKLRQRGSSSRVLALDVAVGLAEAGATAALLLLSAMSLAADSYNPFLYYRF